MRQAVGRLKKEREAMETLTPLQAQAQAQAALRKRGQNFSDEDLAQLCRSWLAVTPEGGGNPKSEVFWISVQDDFAAKFGGVVERTARSLETKWSLVQHSVGKFCGCYTSVVEMSAVEMSEDEITQKALLLYASTNRDRTPFRMLNCWKILRNDPKWIAFRELKVPHKREAELPLALLESPARPLKRVHSIKNSPKPEGTSSMPVSAPVPVTSSPLAKAAAQKAQAMEDAANLNLMTISLDNLEPEAVEYIKLRRQMVMKLLRARAAVVLAEE